MTVDQILVILRRRRNVSLTAHRQRHPGPAPSGPRARRVSAQRLLDPISDPVPTCGGSAILVIVADDQPTLRRSIRPHGSRLHRLPPVGIPPFPEGVHHATGPAPERVGSLHLTAGPRKGNGRGWREGTLSGPCTHMPTGLARHERTHCKQVQKHCQGCSEMTLCPDPHVTNHAYGALLPSLLAHECRWRTRQPFTVQPKPVALDTSHSPRRIAAERTGAPATRSR